MLMYIAAILLVMGVTLYFYQQRPQLNGVLAKVTSERESAIGIKGIVIGPVQMVLIRFLGVPIIAFIISALVGLLVSFVIVASTTMTLFSASQLLLIGLVAMIGGGIITAVLIWPETDDDGKPLVVPTNTVAPLTFFGTLYRIYLLEGDYAWWGRKLFFSRSKVALRDFTTRVKDGDVADGFFKRTPIPFNLYNERPKEKDGKTIIGSSLIEGVAKGGSPVKAELLTTFVSFDPHRALRNDDPGLEIAERARSMFRTCISYFTSVDNAVAKDAMAHLIEGKTIVVAFLLKSADQLAEGSIVRDTGGEPTYFIVEAKAGEDLKNPKDLKKATARTIREYKKHLDAHLTKTMRDAVTIEVERDQKDGSTTKEKEYVIETRSVEIGLNEILEKNGFYLTSASVGHVEISENLSRLAVAAEMQTYENTVQVRSAQATAAALEKLKSSPEQMNDPAYLDKIGIAAASDPGGKSQFIRASTDNKLATVGVAAAVVNQQPSQKPASEAAKD